MKPPAAPSATATATNPATGELLDDLARVLRERRPGEVLLLRQSPQADALLGELTARLEAHFAEHEDSRYDGRRVTELPPHNDWEVWRVTPEEAQRRLAR